MTRRPLLPTKEEAGAADDGKGELAHAGVRDPVAAALERRLRAYYARFNPGNEHNIAEIVAKYRGKEAALCARLKKKYGEAPDLLGVLRPPTVGPGAGEGPRRNVTASTTAPVQSGRQRRRYDPAYRVIRAASPVVSATRGPATLDFGAAEFDALAALRAPGLVPPVARVTPLDNIHKCRHLLPTTDPNHQAPVVATTITPQRSKASAATKHAPSASEPKAPTTHSGSAYLDAVAATYLDGPFMVLRRCFLERRRVRVVLRRVNSIRGTCTGLLKAFDKHMNLVLLDVTEWVIPFALAERRRAVVRDPHALLLPMDEDPMDAALTTPFSVADSRRNRAITVRQFAKQLFIRGDNVVMVLEEPNAAAYAPASAGSKGTMRDHRGKKNCA